MFLVWLHLCIYFYFRFRDRIFRRQVQRVNNMYASMKIKPFIKYLGTHLYKLMGSILFFLKFEDLHERVRGPLKFM